ncbi:MAG: glycoside hydrolase [Actinomycetota bacterium]|nr:glycoside hydrolase [Actinomycetota bacterium]
MPRPVVAALFATLLPLSLAADTQGDEPQPQGVVVEAPRQVTGNPNPTRLFDIPALAVHPDDPLTVVMAVGDARHGGCGLYVSRDGGLSWTNTAPNLMPEDLPFCYQRPLFPVMSPVFASDGTLHVAMPASSPESGHPNGPISMLAARSNDLGVTQEVVTVAEGGRITADPADFGQRGDPQEAFTWYKSPSLAVDPNDPDKLYLAMRWNVWGTDLQAFSGDVPFRPYFARSEDGGETWSEPIDIVRHADGESIYGALNHELVVAPDGTIYSFSREWPAPVPEGAPRPDPRLLMFKSTDGGQRWEISVFLEGVENFRVPYPAVDTGNGNLYVVYGSTGPDTPGDGSPAPQEIYFTASEDGGETWSEPVQISDAPDDNPADSLEPGIDVAPNGRIDVAWHDFRNDPFGQSAATGGHAAGERYWDVYHTHSTDGGLSWAPNIRVTKTSIDGAEGATFNNFDVRGPIGVASTNDAAYIAWADSRASGKNGEAEDAYFTRVRFGVPVEPTAASAVTESRVLWSGLGAGGAFALAGLLLFVGVRFMRAKSGPRDKETLPQHAHERSVTNAGTR